MDTLTQQNIDDIGRIQVWLKDVTTLAPFNSIARTVECNANLRGEIDRLRAELASWRRTCETITDERDEARRLLDEARGQVPEVFVCHKTGTGYQTVVRSQTMAQQYRKEGYSVVGYYAAPVPPQPAAVPAEVALAVQILRKHNEWRRGADNNHWQATPYSPAELGRAIDTVCDHASHSAQPDVLRRATEYAHDLVTWLHRDHYADNTTFEPFGDLLGLLSQIDNMICGWKEPQPAVPDDVAKDAARYRWMRADGPNTYRVIKESARLIGDKFDAAIDAAILSATDDEVKK